MDSVIKRLQFDDRFPFFVFFVQQREVEDRQTKSFPKQTSLIGKTEIKYGRARFM